MNFINGYEVSKTSEIAKSEKNDCVVRALSNVCDIDYNIAHKIAEVDLNRKLREGTYNTFDKLMKFDSIEGFKVKYYGTCGRLFECYNTYTFSKLKPIYNPKYKNQKVGYTIKSFIENHPKGRYLIFTKGHALAIKNGILYDNVEFKNKGHYREVIHVFEFTK
jgi:hypothetical protein